MTISEMIGNLKKTLEESGDIPILLLDTDGEFASPSGAAIMEIEGGKQYMIISTAAQMKIAREVYEEREAMENPPQ